MKRLSKFLKFLAAGLLLLFVLILAGLSGYYHAHYQENPELPPVPPFRFEAPAVVDAARPVLLPVPKQISWSEGVFRMPETVTFSAEADTARIRAIFRHHLHIGAKAAPSGAFRFVQKEGLGPQAYHLSITPRGVTAEYGELPGLFYALTTVKQFIQQSGASLPCADIQDEPALQVRGAMLDISRNKVPKLETLYETVDFLADLKYNHLQLYVEGFSFAYPGFRELWEKTETPITPEEIRQLDAYCRERFIELVPNQNSLGHMMDWLATEQYQHLAECPKGYKLLGLLDMKGTLCPTDPQSLELVKKMSEDLLPNFSSARFNVNLDEPFELGACRSKEAAEQLGKGRVYLDYALELHEYVKSKGKSMMMWGDVVNRHPEILADIPKDITLLEWGYEDDHPFEQRCRALQQAGQPFMVCPGTSTWSSFAGRTDNMLGNIGNAVKNGIRYGAAGMLITDWGDLGHLQYLPASFAGLAYGAALSWNYESLEQVNLNGFLSELVFRDSTHAMGGIALDLGRFNQFEEYPMVAGTTTSFAYQFGLMDKVMLAAINKKLRSGMASLMAENDTAIANSMHRRFDKPGPYHHQAIIEWTNALSSKLETVRLGRPGAALILDEYRNAVRMIQLGAKIKQYTNYRHQQTDAENKALLLEMQALCEQVIREHERLWLARNKKGRLQLTLQPIQKLQSQVEEQLARLEKNKLSRWAQRVVEKIASAGAMVYLR